MPSVPLLNQQGDETGSIDLNDEIFAAEIKQHLFYDVVRMQLANRRNANPATRNRARVSGGGRKPYRQKGTGRARQGSSRSPHFRGGGVVFGPNGRKYTIQLNKKVRRAALRSALSLRLSQSDLLVVEQLVLPAPRTKLFAGMADRLSAARALFVIDATDELLMRSARNIPGLKVLPAAGLNVYDILKYPRLVLTKHAVERIHERLKT